MREYPEIREHYDSDHEPIWGCNGEPVPHFPRSAGAAAGTE